MKNAWENESEIFTLVNSFREFCPEFWLHSYRLVVKQDIMTGSIGAGELLLLKTAEKEWEEKGGQGQADNTGRAKFSTQRDGLIPYNRPTS